MSDDRENKLLAALSDLEERLETPIVPGEMPNWLRAARDQVRAVGEVLLHETQRRHERIREEITEEDLGLASRVEDLEAADKQLVADWETLQAEFQRLAQRAEQVEPDEAKVEDDVQRAADRGLQWVLDVRKQEKALTTWLVESLNRDRGVAD